MKLIALASLLTLVPALALAGEASEKAAADLLKKKMQTENPADLHLLESVKGKDIVVVAGTMDHIEQVLAAAGIRHTLIAPAAVAAHDLSADQILMVNCPGNIPAAGVARIEKFVRAGGLLYTTDWALLNVVQRAFPRTIKHNGGGTHDELVHVRVHDAQHNLMSDMLIKGGTRPQWWLEGGSYPIQIVDRERVKILASSPAMGQKYGASPVVVKFKWDDGAVIHVVSHFYRQLDAKGPQIAAGAAIDQVKGLSPKQKADFKASSGASVNFDDVASSYAFQRMTTNLIVGKSKENQDLDKSYDLTPAASVTLEGRKVAKGDRLKVVGKRGGKLRVRDDRGNEGEVDAAEVEAR